MSAPEHAAEPRPEPTPEPTPRKRRWPFWVGGAIGFVGILLAALPSLLSSDWTRDLIHGWLAENVDRHVTFADLDVSWSGGIVLRELVVAEAPGAPTPLLTAPVVRLDAPLLPLLSRRLEVREFVFEDPVVNLAVDGGNAEHVFKRKKRKGGRGGERRDGDEKKDDAPKTEQERLSLPDITAPVEVRNLTLVLRDPAGGHARQTGIAFQGSLTTRGGPTTFDLRIPTGGGGVTLTGEARLFDDEGLELPPAERTVDAVLALDGIDAAHHRALIALFFPDLLVTGVLDGRVEALTQGDHTAGKLDVRLSGLGENEPVTVAGSFDLEGGRVALEGFEMHGAGLDAKADISGTTRDLRGEGRFDADLARLAEVLRAAGIEVPGELAGRLEGALAFAGEGAPGSGRIELTGFRAAGMLEDRAPVEIQRAALTFEVVPGPERLLLQTAELTLPGLTATATGERLADRSAQLDAEVRGDLGGVLAMLRDAGLLPAGFALNGDVAGALHVARDAEGALAVTTPSFVLTTDGARIELRGGLGADGSLDATAQGSGQLGPLLAQAKTPDGDGPDLDAIRGRFELRATASGTADAPDIHVERLHIDGDARIDATGRLGADRAISADITADGSVAELERLLLRLGLLQHPLGLDGKLAAKAQVGGTAGAPLVPSFRLEVTEGAVTAKVTARIADGGSLMGSVDIGGPTDDLLRVIAAQRGLDPLPTIGGTFRFGAAASGTLEHPEIPTAKLTFGGPARLEFTGRRSAEGALRVDADIRSDLAFLAGVKARMKDPEAPASSVRGSLALKADLHSEGDDWSARLEHVEAESAGFRITGDGEADAGGQGGIRLFGSGPAASALDLFAAFGFGGDWTGEGKVEMQVEAARAGDRVRGKASLRGDITLRETGEEPMTLREPGLSISTGEFDYDTSTGALAPTPFRIESEGGVLTGNLARPAVQEGAPSVLSADGEMRLRRPFALNHADLLSGVAFDTLDGSFRFSGDVSEGREGAAGWVGDIDLTGKRIEAEYVTADDATAKAEFQAGALQLRKVHANLNGGALDATGSIGLVGKNPPHQLSIRARDIALDSDLAPLLARISPLLAGGGEGTVSGRVSLSADLTSKGLKGKRLKKHAAGAGELALDGVTAESTGWVGKLLGLVGGGDKLEIAAATIPFEIKDGKVLTGQIPLRTGRLELLADGSATLDGALDYVLRVKPTGGSSVIDRLGPLLDDEGYLKLALDGDVGSPDLHVPAAGDLKDELGDRLGDLWDKLRGKDDDEDKDSKKRKKKRKKKKPKADVPEEEEEPPPPPPLK